MQLGYHKNRLCIHKHVPCVLVICKITITQCFQLPNTILENWHHPSPQCLRFKNKIYHPVNLCDLCHGGAPSILLDNSHTRFVISGLLCLVRYSNVPTPDLYMDCVFSSTFEISSTFPPINHGVPGVIVIFFFATLSPNCFSKLLVIVGCPN